MLRRPGGRGIEYLSWRQVLDEPAKPPPSRPEDAGEVDHVKFRPSVARVEKYMRGVKVAMDQAGLMQGPHHACEFFNRQFAIVNCQSFESLPRYGRHYQEAPPAEDGAVLPDKRSRPIVGTPAASTPQCLRTPSAPGCQAAGR